MYKVPGGDLKKLPLVFSQPIVSSGIVNYVDTGDMTVLHRAYEVSLIEKEFNQIELSKPSHFKTEEVCRVQLRQNEEKNFSILLFSLKSTLLFLYK